MDTNTIGKGRRLLQKLDQYIHNILAKYVDGGCYTSNTADHRAIQRYRMDYSELWSALKSSDTVAIRHILDKYHFI